MSIKKLTALLLAMAMTLALASCGKPAAPAAPDGSASASASVSAASSSEGSQSAPDEEPESAAVTVTFNDVDASSFAEDDVMLLDCTYQTATVTAADAAVQEKIQKDLDKVTEELMTERESYLELSTEEYATINDPESYALVDEAGNYAPYYLHLEGTVTRSDEAVLSILFAEDTYAHGAHGGHVLFTCNYDAKTGERLTFEMLGEDFRSTAEGLVLAKADEMEAEAISSGEEGLFFPNYADSIRFVVLDGSETLGDLWGDLFEGAEAEETAAATTYFTDTAVVFISTEYTMQSYAVGTIEFEIPYADFDGVMNADYLPQ